MALVLLSASPGLVRSEVSWYDLSVHLSGASTCFVFVFASSVFWGLFLDFIHMTCANSQRSLTLVATCRPNCVPSTPLTAHVSLSLSLSLSLSPAVLHHSCPRFSALCLGLAVAIPTLSGTCAPVSRSYARAFFLSFCPSRLGFPSCFSLRGAEVSFPAPPSLVILSWFIALGNCGFFSSSQFPSPSVVSAFPFRSPNRAGDKRGFFPYCLSLGFISLSLFPLFLQGLGFLSRLPIFILSFLSPLS